MKTYLLESLMDIYHFGNIYLFYLLGLLVGNLFTYILQQI